MRLRPSLIYSVVTEIKKMKDFLFFFIFLVILLVNLDYSRVEVAADAVRSARLKGKECR